MGEKKPKSVRSLEKDSTSTVDAQNEKNKTKKRLLKFRHPKNLLLTFEKEEVKGHKEVSTVCGGRITVDQSVHL